MCLKQGNTTIKQLTDEINRPTNKSSPFMTISALDSHYRSENFREIGFQPASFAIYCLFFLKIDKFNLPFIFRIKRLGMYKVKSATDTRKLYWNHYYLCVSRYAPYSF